MSVHITVPAPGTDQAEPTIDAQRSTFEALLLLARNHPHLPAPYARVYAPVASARALPVVLHLQLESPQDFEAWRAALGIDPRTVGLLGADGFAWLVVDGHYGGVELHVTGFGVPLYAVASTPELVAQRHEWADPAEPPAYCSARAAAAPAAPVVTA